MRTHDKILSGLIMAVLLACAGTGSQASPVSPMAVNLGSAADYVVLSKAGLSSTGWTSLVGDVGVCPIASTGVTGFHLVMNSMKTYATSPIVNGKVYAADFAAPTPAKLTKAVSDMETAFIDAGGRTNPAAIDLGAGDLSGITVTPGVYKWGTGLLITTGVALDGKGDKNAVFIFQIAGNLTVANGAVVTLRGGVQAKNVFWQTTGQSTLGTNSSVQGNLLSKTAIVMKNGAKLNGRALAQTAVTLDSNNVQKAN